MSPFETLTLPNGSSLPNRIAKAAMEENMADAAHVPSAELLRLYHVSYTHLDVYKRQEHG